MNTHSHCQYDFLQCLSANNILDIVHTPINSSFIPTLKTRIGNHRFDPSPNYPIPALIVTPVNESQIQTVVLCAKQTGMLIRIRSGGNEFEGISYTARYSFATTPFFVLDVSNLNEITIDVEQKTAWIQAGATMGQLYYRLNQLSSTLTFPGGVWPSVAAGGYISGGGYTILLRKYGFAADNVVDARIVDVDGRILDRRTMGEDVFWAIRGGSATFGVVTAWKLGLVTVPENNTIFSVRRSLEQNATQLVHKWQSVGPNLPQELTLYPTVTKVGSTIEATFDSYFLGSPDVLVELLQQRFPELGVTREDCTEVSWIQVTLFCAGYSIHDSPEVLYNAPTFDQSFIIKTDYMQEPIPENGLERLWNFLGNEISHLQFGPHGGRMAEISESALPIPHRNYLFHMEEKLVWDPSFNNETEIYVNGVRRVYEFMTPFASKSPRAVFVNHRDLDVGVNEEGNTSYLQAKVWGEKYYNRNFPRLAKIKAKFDPKNFFRHEQSVPPFPLAINKEVEDGNRFADQ